MRAFIDKGRFSDLLKTMPVHVVMNPRWDYTARYWRLRGSLAGACWITR
jgi:hypothetical protein